MTTRRTRHIVEQGCGNCGGVVTFVHNSPRLRRLGSAIIGYELAFGRNALEDLRQSHRWKILVTLVVVASVVGVIVGSYAVDTDGIEVGHGASAAASALGAAAMVFISMIRAESEGRRFADHLVRAMSGILALLAGWFWLLAETGGHAWPFLLGIAPISGVLIFVVVLGTLLDVVTKAEDKLIAERKEEALIQELRQLDPVHGE